MKMQWERTKTFPARRETRMLNSLTAHSTLPQKEEWMWSKLDAAPDIRELFGFVVLAFPFHWNTQIFFPRSLSRSLRRNHACLVWFYSSTRRNVKNLFSSSAHRLWVLSSEFYVISNANKMFILLWLFLKTSNCRDKLKPLNFDSTIKPRACFSVVASLASWADTKM